MANVKISQLPTATTLTTADLLPVVQGGVTKQVTPDLLPVSTPAAAALAANATADRARANHTGTQATSTITGLDTALAAKADLVGGLVPSSQIPAIALTNAVTVASQAAMLALTTTQVQPGDVAVRTDGAGTFILTATDPTQLGNWTRLNAPTDAVTTVNGQTGTVVLAATDVGAAPSSLSTTVATNTSNIATNTSAIAAQRLGGTVNAITSNATAVIGVRNTVDATTAPVTVTLPTPTVVGQRLIIERLDASTTNSITITGTIRGVAASTAVLPAVGAANEGGTWVAESLTSWTPEASIKPKAWLDALYGASGVDIATKSDLTNLVFHGDSHTLGNQDGSGVTYPLLLANALSDVSGNGPTVYNKGQFGWTSTDVAILQGAIDPVLGAFTIPTTAGSVAVTVTAPTGIYRANGTGGSFYWTGVIKNSSGTVIGQGNLIHNVNPDGTWQFYALTLPGSPVSVPAGATFHCTDNDGLTDKTAVIMVGRNDIANQANVLSDIAAMVAHLSPTVKRYLILSVLTMSTETSGTAGYNQVTAINAALAATYGNQYVDVRSYIVKNGLTFSNLTPTTADNTAVAADTIAPQLLLGDNLHPNQYGYRALAKAVLDRLIALGWVKGIYNPIPSAANPYLSSAPNILTDGSFEAGTLTYQYRQGTGGTAARSTSAAHTGTNGLRIAFTAANTGAAVDVYTNIDTTIAHAASVWVRSSKAASMTLGVLYYSGGYGNTLQSQYFPANKALQANTWTKLQFSLPPGPNGGTLALTIANDGQTWAAGDTLDIDDVVLVRGSAIP